MRFILIIVFAAMPLFAAAQPYPSKPVRIIVNFPAGGIADLYARIIGGKVQEAWGQPVVIENRTGAGGNIGADAVAKSAPDGYTLNMSAIGPHAINVSLFARMPFDPVKDFAPVAHVLDAEGLLVVHPSLPINSVSDLIAYGRANPGKLTFGHAGIGSQTHLAAENFVWQAKMDAVAVPYKGEGPGLAAAVAGETNFFLGNVAAAIGHISGGRLRALGVTSKDEAPQLPGVPPIGKTIAGFENNGWFGIVAPTGTPKQIVQKVYTDTKKALEASDLRGRLYVQGLAPVGNTPEEMAKEMKEESALWARVVNERKIQVK